MEKENKVIEEVGNREFSKIKGRCDLRKLSSVLLEQRLLHGYLGGVLAGHTPGYPLIPHGIVDAENAV